MYTQTYTTHAFVQNLKYQLQYSCLFIGLTALIPITIRNMLITVPTALLTSNLIILEPYVSIIRKKCNTCHIKTTQMLLIKY